MCGFVGFTGYLENRNDILKRMADRIIHRGPDMEGYHHSDAAEGSLPVSLGFRRLSIIDLADGAQPMYNEDGTVVCVFNGEIYNFSSLRDELISKGHIFRTRCDTEVLVHGFEQWGESLVDRLRGMFAFVISDSRSNTLFGARDHFGIKPFYYTLPEEGIFIFGSEIKSFFEHPAFRAEMNGDVLRPYLTFQYSSTEETFFKGTFKLLPGHCFTYRDGKLTTRRYWDVDFSKKDTFTFDEAAAAVDRRIHESVAAHRISDVPVGAFLSGGVDSSYITSTLMPQETFSVGFGLDKFDETRQAHELSDILGIDHINRILSADECFDALADIQYHMDEPQSNPSSVPLYFLAKLASEHVTVVLSGEGADEIYGGYEWYDETPLMRKYKKLPSILRRGAAGVVSALPYFKGHDFIIRGSGRPENYFIGQAHVFPEKEALATLSPKYRGGIAVSDITSPVYERVKGLSELERKQYLDMKLWLPGDILLKADKMSMAHSLELRVPFLDKHVMEEAARIPASYKITPTHTKHVLRAASAKTLPPEWVNRPKMGFPVPVRKWLREDKYYSIAKEYFTSDTASEYFMTDRLLRILDNHREGKENNGRMIWTALVFLVWHKRFFGAL